MNTIFEKIEEWLKNLCIGMISRNLDSLFTGVNEKSREINAQVALTPSTWDSDIWNMVMNIANVVIIPIAGIILTYVMCMELISLASDKNNMHSTSDILQMFIKFIIKTFIAVLVVQKSQKITIGMFDLGNWAVSHASSFISKSTSINIETSVTAIAESLKEQPLSYCIEALVITTLAKLCIVAIMLVINVILIGRMIEIYLYCSIGPLPLSTIVNKEIGGMGQNYIKSLAALAFQGFFIAICISIYNVLVQRISFTDDINNSLFWVIVYTAVLCFTMIKTRSISNSVFNAH